MALGALALLLATTPATAQTSLSIYSDGRVVVRRTLPRALNKGRNVVSFDPGSSGIDPGFVFALDSDVTIASVIARPATSRSDALEQAVGSTLDFVRAKGDTVRATVVRNDPPQYRLPDNRFLLVIPGEPLFPKELVRAPTLEVTLDAARAKPAADLAWVTEGVRWSAAYQVVLEAQDRASITGTATVVSQGLSADSASVQLVAGTIARTQPQPQPLAARMAGAVALGAVDVVTEGAIGDVHVYTLPNPLTIEAGTPVSVALFSSVRTTTVREYVLPGLLPFQGYPGAVVIGMGSDRVPVQVWYTLKHTQGTNFGDRPLPAGTLQLFERDAAGHVQLVGEAATRHTAAGADVRVQTGQAFDVTAIKVQTDFSEQPVGPAQRGQPARRRVTAAYRVTLSNAKPDAVTVDVREVHAGQWSVITSSVQSAKLSATEVRFRVTVPARGETTLTYTVQVDS